MAVTIEQRRKEIEMEILNLQRQVDEMDTKIRAYLADRENKPHPRFQEFVARIQLFRIDRSLTNRQLETMLDNLQWKVYYYNRSWRQLWENAEAMHRIRANSAKKDAVAEEGDGPDRRGIYSVDRLWDIQQDKLRKLGVREPEDKTAFVQRIKQRYGQLAAEKKADEEIVMTFDKNEKRCTLEIKNRKNDA